MEQQTGTTPARETQAFGDAFAQFGQQMATWGETFGQRMAVWGEDFGQRMEAWGKEMAESMGQLGDHLGESFAVGKPPAVPEADESPAASEGSNLQEERLNILRMVAEGKISVAEASDLLRALGE